MEQLVALTWWLMMLMVKLLRCKENKNRWILSNQTLGGNRILFFEWKILCASILLRARTCVAALVCRNLSLLSATAFCSVYTQSSRRIKSARPKCHGPRQYYRAWSSERRPALSTRIASRQPSKGLEVPVASASAQPVVLCYSIRQRQVV